MDYSAFLLALIDLHNREIKSEILPATINDVTMYEFPRDYENGRFSYSYDGMVTQLFKFHDDGTVTEWHDIFDPDVAEDWPHTKHESVEAWKQSHIEILEKAVKV